MLHHVSLLSTTEAHQVASLASQRILHRPLTSQACVLFFALGFGHFGFGALVAGILGHDDDGGGGGER